MNAQVRRALIRTTLAAALASPVLGACDDGPTRPSPPATPRPPAPVTVIGLEIRGPGTVPPGESAQYSAIENKSDGSTRDVTTEAVWTSVGPPNLTISPTGVVTGHQRGEAGTQAAASGLRAHKQLLILPAGTYRLSGSVRDGFVPVTFARVEVTAGTGQGLAMPTNGGQYYLYGVAGDIAVRLIAEGYQEQVQRLNVADHQTLDFVAVPLRPRADVSGTYTLKVTAAAECSSALPAEARSRTYTAVISQDGPQLTVTLEGSTFFESAYLKHNRFAGTVVPTHITVHLGSGSIGYYGFNPPDVLERLSDTSLFTVSGWAPLTASANPLSNSLHGTIEMLEAGPSWPFERIAACGPAWHQFVLAR
jgi:hypothetical protein